MQRSDSQRVSDMLTEIDDIAEFVEGYDIHSYLADLRTMKAVAYSLQVMGEAARGTSLQFKADHPEVPWAKIVGMRHRIAHKYGAVNFRIVWAVALEDLPGLRAALQSLVKE